MICPKRVASLFLVTCMVGIHQVAAQDLSTLLSRFQAEQDRAAKEAILENITTGYPDAGSALLKIASTTAETDTTWLAIRGIGRLKFKDAAPFLKQSLSSRSNYVRANAARALGEIHDVSATSDLMRTLKSEQDSGVIEQTALALQMLGAHEAVPLLKTMAANPSPQTRVWILGAVETLGSKPDIPFFATFLFDENEIVAAYAARALERFTGKDFGFPKCGPGPCSFGEGVNNARRWWNDHKQDWKR
jgi:HEAT repeat protein